MDQEVRRYRVSEAYLEMAKAFLHTDIVQGDSQKTSEMPNELVYALCANNFQNAYLAVCSFLIDQVTSCYRSNEKFRDSFASKDLETVLKRELRDLPELLKATSRGLQIEPLHKGNPRLNQQLNELVKEHRHFLTHPNPLAFHEKLSVITEKIEWGFPASIARDAICYFFEKTNTPLPNWLLPDAKLFRIPRVEIFDQEVTEPMVALQQQPARYSRYAKTGEVVDFQYDNNDGCFIIGDHACSVTLKFSQAGTDSVHVYRDKCKSVRRADGVSEVNSVRNPRSFDGSSRSRTARIGDIVLWENSQGRFFATKFTSIKYPYMTFDFSLLDETTEWSA